jgi:hypothetical protein
MFNAIVAPFPGYIGTTLKVPFEQEGKFFGSSSGAE